MESFCLHDGSNDSASDNSGWLDLESDNEISLVTSLFDSQTFTTLDKMLEYCKKHFDFDLVANVRRLQLDYVGAIKLVNYIRLCVRQGQALPDLICINHIVDDIYLKPVMDDDAVLFSLDDVLSAPIESSNSQNSQISRLTYRNQELEADLKSVQDRFANYRLTVEETLNKRWGSDDGLPWAQSGTLSTSFTKPPDLDNYFESYASSEIHEIMLKDEVRTDAYRDFIYANKHLFVGKVILDIGCGTGILSMLCAKAGAARVLAVDKSDIVDKARENVFNNGMSKVIKCLRGAIEDIVLPVDKVDIIISEWMGYCLLYEAMLPSVLYARDKYLKSEGMIVPSSATLWIAPVEDQVYLSDNVAYWRDVYGFDMRAMQEGIYDDVRIENMAKTSLCGEAFPFQTFDLRSVRREELEFTARWSSALTSAVGGIDGFLIWFDIFFSPSGSHEPPPDPYITPAEWSKMRAGNYGFTTGPYGRETHWKQGLLLLAQPVSRTDLPTSRLLSGTITVSVPKQHPRALSLHQSWSTSDRKNSQSWNLK
ncbi:hypothetical protein L249_5971 [Ophiocordyceps polyrhachis-furcata BCC 54312]|uniref:type I protein arginine methyltransferase n=1 Tax=Ophiocordyceps polyrhachis-furcata BCC 54312 TaxID=1330021 RepID=A0A367LJ76_9HYPO|nr:hypothetical protein L249_5971 [Ophiocordyceps polyrhachis-furcata BCC 54312]